MLKLQYLDSLIVERLHIRVTRTHLRSQIRRRIVGGDEDAAPGGLRVPGVVVLPLLDTRPEDADVPFSARCGAGVELLQALCSSTWLHGAGCARRHAARRHVVDTVEITCVSRGHALEPEQVTAQFLSSGH